MHEFQFVVFSNPVAGREAEYNRWYQEQHLPDVVKVPGVVSAQRFQLADNSTMAHRYLALYEIRTDNIEAVMQDIYGRVGTAEMPMSDALDIEGVAMHVFAATGPKVCK